ncbi:MAG: hypothetical protein LBQ09_11835, partial [Acidobacteriaceae bacterium]|nr:hypothetical protein [Acidobacteriaceae bacterium]
MSRTLTLALLLTCVLLVPSRADAWGAVGHRLIMRRAIALLPAELKPFFEKNSDEVVMRSNDPDL